MSASTTIVNVQDILSRNEMLEENWNLRKLVFPEKINVLEWLARRKLIKNSVECNCGIQIGLQKKSELSDGYRWKCKGCEKTLSFRNGSFFTGSHLGLIQLIVIIYCWSRDCPQKDIAHEAEPGQGSTHTVIDWCQFCRDIYEQYLIDNPPIIGGLDKNCRPKIVEIDESKFFHRKYHRGLWRPGHCVFGGIERGSGNCFLVEVPDRRKATLTALIERYILPGTVIMPDGWAAYANIENIGGGLYEHEIIIHEENFVDPHDPGVHTQSIENTWIRAKKNLKRQCGTSEALFSSYLHEFVFRNKFKNNMFMNFLLCVNEQYQI